VQELLPEGFEVAKLRRDKPLNLSKDFMKRLCTEVFEQVLETCMQLDKDSWNKHLF
jgi:hypothetical protein